MATYPLQAVMNLRHRRLDSAKNKQSKARHNLEDAKLKYEQAKHNLDQYKIFKLAEIDRRYQAIMNTAKTQQEMMIFNQGLASLDNEELNLMQLILESEKNITKAKEQVNLATAEVQAAKKGLMKIEVHHDLWLEDYKKEQERLADLEMEDFHPKKQYDFN